MMPASGRQSMGEIEIYVPASRYSNKTPTYWPVIERAARFLLVALFEWATLVFVERADPWFVATTLVVCALGLGVLESRKWLNFRGAIYFPTAAGILAIIYIMSIAAEVWVSWRSNAQTPIINAIESVLPTLSPAPKEAPPKLFHAEKDKEETVGDGGTELYVAKYYQRGIVKSAEIIRNISELLVKNQKKPMTWSITATSDNEQIREEISSIMEGACHVVGLRAGLNGPCLIEPIQPFPAHPTLENPAQALPEATNAGIVIHNSGGGAEFENTYRVLSEAFAVACVKVQRSSTLPPIIAAVHGGDDPDFFWIEIGPGDPWADSRCFG